MSDLEIIFKEILPNLLPFIAAAFVGAGVCAPCSPRSTWPCSALGPLREPLLGNIIWAAQLQGAFFNGWWWWPIVPVAGDDPDPRLARPDQHGPGRDWPTRACGGRNDDMQTRNAARVAAEGPGRTSQVTYYTDAGRAPRAGRRQLHPRMPGEKLGLVGESGSGKSDHGAGHDAHDQAAGPDRRRQGHRRRHRPDGA